MLILVAWGTVPLGVLGSVVLPKVMPIIFGDGWELATQLASALSLICGVQVVTTVLGSAVESLGKFRWIWSSQAIMIGIQAVAVILTIERRSAWPAIVAMGIVVIARQVWYVWLCSRVGYINVRRLLSGYRQVVVTSVAGAVIFWFVMESATDPVYLCLAMSLVLAIGFLAWRRRQRIPPIVILRRYGLL